MSKTFTHAGVSSLKGEFKIRFASDALRVKVLAKNGHKDIDIIQLKNPMSKEDAVAYLIAMDFATQNGVTNQAVQAALEDAVDKRATKAPKAKVKAKPTMEGIKAKIAAKVKTPQVAAIKGMTPMGYAEAEAAVGLAPDVANLEDAPF